MDDHKHDYYFDRGAGIIAVHDFPTGVPLDDSYPAVKAKYDRRIDRFYRTIRASRRVLLVYWTWRVYSKPEAILKAAEIFRAKFPEQRVDLLVIRNADDLVEWLFAVLDRGASGRPYNVGSPEGLSIRDLAEGVRTALDAKNDIRVLGVPASGMSPSVYVPDVSRAVRELGLRVTVSLANAVRKSTVLR